MLPDYLLIFIVLAPGIIALLTGVFHKLIGDRAVMTLTTGVILACAALSFTQLFSWAFGAHEGAHATHIITLLNWVDVGGFKADWAIRVDGLSVTMLAVITGVSSLVHLYSWGYMAQDPHRSRFFAYLSLFTFAMLMLVVADNFLQLFFGWEGVGLASYLLIGFWYEKAAPNAASVKAFVTNRVGDFGLALGIMAVFVVFGTVEFAPIFEAVKANATLTPLALADPAPIQSLVLPILGYQIPALELIGCLLFVGAMGKSAQFFLHVWLPDAMEGPTPVSALIHAATMVTAGVYMVCLLSAIYQFAPVASAFITIIGAVTALFAATIGLAQNDIKRVIAYSTCSQLGYMFMVAGIGVYEAAMFHLFTHAFFKALLFLGAGSVIHGMHHEQDMRNMGGLWRHMKLTYGAMLLGTFAIIGLGIPFTSLGFAGFFSKDAIIESAFVAGMAGQPYAYLGFGFGLIAAALTSFYSWRLILMTFHGPEVWNKSHNDDASSYDENHHAHTPHESGWVMLIPLALLSLGAVFAGWAFYDPMFHHGETFWGEAIFRDNHYIHDIYALKKAHTADWMFWSPLVVTIFGFILALYAYGFRRGLGKRMADNNGPVNAFLSNKWYFDEIYRATFIAGTHKLASIFNVIDKKFIDRIGPDGAAFLTQYASGRIAKAHSGRLYHYAFAIILAALLAGGYAVLFLGSA